MYTSGYCISVTMVTGSEISTSRSDFAMTKSVKNELKTGFFRKFSGSKLQMRSKNIIREISEILDRNTAKQRDFRRIYVHVAYGTTRSIVHLPKFSLLNSSQLSKLLCKSQVKPSGVLFILNIIFGSSQNR